MRAAVAFAGLVALALLGRAPALRVAGGETVDIGDAPYTVSLLLDWSGGGVYSQACAGAVVRRDVVLTAAQCPDETLSHQWRVRAGTPFTNTGGQIMTLDRFLVHPSFGAGLDYDFALLFLSNSLILGPQTALVPLADQGSEVPAGAATYVVGWGSTEEGGNAVNALRGTTLSAVARGECASAYQSVNPVTERMVCAGGADRGACPGDAGGPLTVDGRLYGLHSWTVGCARPGYPGVWARVAAVRSWIDAEIAQ